jgi:hypothetical protein
MRLFEGRYFIAKTSTPRYYLIGGSTCEFEGDIIQPTKWKRGSDKFIETFEQRSERVEEVSHEIPR